ncbi:hypothetical protein ACP275_02G134200 [Erythranthe tilingii]
MEARKNFALVFFLTFVFAAAGQQLCGIQLPMNSCTDDATCKAKCIPLSYTIGFCDIGGPVPRRCTCQRPC